MLRGEVTEVQRPVIFVSYSHRDRSRWLDRLLVIFKPYVRKGHLEIWADPYIQVGDQWRREINNALKRTSIAVLLVSPDFLASDFIYEEELPPLIKGAENKSITLFAIPISSVDPEISDLGVYQWAHEPSAPLDSLDEADCNAALVRIVKQISDFAKTLTPAQELVSPIPRAALRQESRTIALGMFVVDPTGKLGELHGVPNQKQHVVARPDDLAGVRETLLQSTQQTVGITGSPFRSDGRTVGLHGMGGIGKTVLAIALIQDETVRRAFPDGIYWLTLGQEPKLSHLQSQLMYYATGEEKTFASITLGQEYVRKLFADRASLVVLDDLWNLRDADTFDVLGPRCRLLTTTRDRTLLTALAADEISLDVLPDGLALQVLALWSGQPRDELPQTAREVASECGYLPLALSLAGARVRDGATWHDVLTALANGRIEFLDHPYGSVFSCLKLSVDNLPQEMAARYEELAIFPEDTDVPVSTVCRLWRHTDGLEAFESHRLLTDLQGKALLYKAGMGQDERLSFHDLQYDYLRLSADNLPALHRRLLDAYRSDLPNVKSEETRGQTDWSKLSANEPYLWTHLASHLADAGLRDELLSLLLDYNWIATKLEATNIHALINDYDWMPEDEVARLVQQALKLSAHVLVHNKTELAGQLIGRLLGHDQTTIQKLIESIIRLTPGPWLAPQTSSLSQAGGPLVRIFSGHKKSVTTVALTPNEQFVVSGSYDQTVRLWDLASGVEVRELEGHTSVITSVAVTLDGQFTLSGSEDHTIRLWSLTNGTEAWCVSGHKDRITSLSVQPDNRAFAVFYNEIVQVRDLQTGVALGPPQRASRDFFSKAVTQDQRFAVRQIQRRAVWLWDVERRSAVVRLACSDAEVVGRTLAVTPDQRFAVSVSGDRTIHLWDLKSGNQLRQYKGHDGVISSVAITHDARFAVSTSSDRTCRLWDLSPNATVQPLERHEGQVTSVAVTTDGMFAISGSEDHTVRLWNLDSGAEVRRFQGHNARVSSVAVTPNGRFALSGSFDTGLGLWELETGKLCRSFPPRYYTDVTVSLAVTPDSRVAISCSDTHTMRMWDLESGAELRQFHSNSSGATSVAISSSGRFALSGYKNGRLRLWDLADGAEVRLFEGHDGPVTSVALTLDGRFALSSSWDNTLKLWDLSNGAEVRRFEGHHDTVNSVTLTPNGRFAFSGCDDHTARLWDLKDGNNVASFTADTGVASVACAHDDLFIAGADDGSLHILKLIE